MQKNLKFASFAAPAGNIQEVLSVGCLGPPEGLDVPGGRLMGDVTTIWTLGVLELYQNQAAGGGAAGAMQFLSSVYPTLKNALAWQLAQCNNPGAPDLPYKLVCTCAFCCFCWLLRVICGPWFLR